ncbi:hypothetical protein [Carnimonas bestiolae]|uniref:hypothetical protein n=1 Tax=Carnimonas bestiolae TaxID=3402172 RepID=UPI003EDBAD64
MDNEQTHLKARINKLEAEVSSLIKRLEKVDTSCSAKIGLLDKDIKNIKLSLNA